MRKRDTPYRSSLALALVLCLLAGLMLACSTGETKGNSLWGKQLTAEKETVPAEAVDGKYGYCIGVARNSRLLLTDDRSIWLYDGETKEQIPLIPGDEETEAKRKLRLLTERSC